MKGTCQSILGPATKKAPSLLLMQRQLMLEDTELVVRGGQIHLRMGDRIALLDDVQLANIKGLIERTEGVPRSYLGHPSFVSFLTLRIDWMEACLARDDFGEHLNLAAAAFVGSQVTLGEFRELAKPIQSRQSLHTPQLRAQEVVRQVYAQFSPGALPEGMLASLLESRVILERAGKKKGGRQCKR